MAQAPVQGIPDGVLHDGMLKDCGACKDFGASKDSRASKDFGASGQCNITMEK